MVKMFRLLKNDKKESKKKYPAMWICPKCDMAIDKKGIKALEKSAYFYHCPGCGYKRVEENFLDRTKGDSDDG